MADEFPLMLLSEQGLPELARSFSNFLTKSEDVFLFRGHSERHIELTFCGVRFSCKLGEVNGDLSGAKQVMLNGNLAENAAGISIGFSELVNSELPILPLIKAMLELGSKLSDSLPVPAILWVPANIACGPEFFKESIGDFIAGGAFPCLSLVRFESSSGNIIRTNGLAWFSNQEIEMDAADMGENEAIRRLVRIIHDIVENGAVAEDTQVAGLAADETLSISVNMEENLVYIQRMSKVDI